MGSNINGNIADTAITIVIIIYIFINSRFEYLYCFLINRITYNTDNIRTNKTNNPPIFPPRISSYLLKYINLFTFII